MRKIRIRIYRGDGPDPDTTITIPAPVLKVASRLIPGPAAAALREKGIDVDAVLALCQSPDITGTVVEVEDHRKRQRIVIAAE